MAKWNFSTINNSLVITLDTSESDVLPQSKSLMQPSVSLSLDKIILKESGNYFTSLAFCNIGTIDGATPTDLLDANDKILLLIPTSSGGGISTSYNTPTLYDTPADLPLTFGANTIHAISILCLTGTLTCTISGETVVYGAGEGTDIEASGLIDQQISIDSTTGTFLISILS